ncbi:hypothetical protein PRIPAC_86879 [Pristionchus pacificus]|uniref:Uncharacterized protein n=1 Tax=Pristionchus pacificus TaxID=54126 RepID=A0A454Y3D5_PRIPA|nr:hypothetical protein PRIPAC_86879 [Pristionchus pacificus]|eukprot:PDM66333.1 hypothetical protein PRIPAC_47750 [Pristionchus pacificus]
MARRVVVPSLLVLLLLLGGLVEASDVLGALKDRNHSSHSAVALIFAFGLAVIVVIIAVVVLTLCCCDRPPPKRQHYVAAAAASGPSAAGGGLMRYDRVVAAVAAPAAGPGIQRPEQRILGSGATLYHGGLLPRAMPPNGSRYPRVHSPFLV